MTSEGAALKMLVVPLVLVSLVVGVTALGDLSALGRLGAKTFGLYLLPTAVAVAIALALATAVGPGTGSDPGSRPSASSPCSRAPSRLRASTSCCRSPPTS